MIVPQLMSAIGTQSGHLFLHRTYGNRRALGEQSNYRAALVSNAVLPNKIGRKSNLATNRARQHLRYKACSSRNVAEAKT